MQHFVTSQSETRIKLTEYAIITISTHKSEMTSKLLSVITNRIAEGKPCLEITASKLTKELQIFALLQNWPATESCPTVNKRGELMIYFASIIISREGGIQDVICTKFY